MTSDAACVTTSVASSNTIQISINTDVAPAVKITSSADTVGGPEVRQLEIRENL
jgi:hypothetical protein